uniref:Uncharacterized protein n=1 Tax=Panagrolaimus superbus TaxID=310955 RepID=A0A914XUL4_9BILA
MAVQAMVAQVMAVQVMDIHNPVMDMVITGIHNINGLHTLTIPLSMISSKDNLLGDGNIQCVHHGVLHENLIPLDIAMEEDMVVAAAMVDMVVVIEHFFNFANF